MGRYIGSRYIPIIKGQWNIDTPYEHLTKVINDGKTYISKTNVPSGIDISNDNYWLLLNDKSLIDEQQDERLTTIESEVTTLQGQMSSNNTSILNINTSLNSVNSKATNNETNINNITTELNSAKQNITTLNENVQNIEDTMQLATNHITKNITVGEGWEVVFCNLLKISGSALLITASVKKINSVVENGEIVFNINDFPTQDNIYFIPMIGFRTSGLPVNNFTFNNSNGNVSIYGDLTAIEENRVFNIWAILEYKEV